MNWKILAIILIVVVVLVGAYSLGLFQQDEEVLDDGTAEVSESFDISASVQSDFWDGFGDWLWVNAWWMCAGGLIIWGVTSYKKAR